jgi:hypothetical protein
MSEETQDPQVQDPAPEQQNDAVKPDETAVEEAPAFIQLRITDPSMSNYTGPFGDVQFVDGLQVEEAHPASLRTLCSLISCEVVGRESESALEIADRAVGVFLDAPAPIVRYATAVENGMVDDRMGGDDAGTQVPDETREKKIVWIKEALEAIADKDGINGLRDIGDEFNVKARSITDLIDAILAAQAGQ